MIYYNSKFELVRQLYDTFVDTLVTKGVYPYSGSGTDFLQMLNYSVTAALASGELPVSHQSAMNVPAANLQVQKYQDSIIALANQMAFDVIQVNSDELHEWSLGKAIRSLCPLWPFLKEPCANYGYLTGYNN